MSHPEDSSHHSQSNVPSHLSVLSGLLMGGADAIPGVSGGTIALILGLLVRPAAAVLAFTMVIAIVTVHLGNGLFMNNDGYEFGLALLAASVALAISGAGRGSLDAVLSGDQSRSRV